MPSSARAYQAKDGTIRISSQSQTILSERSPRLGKNTLIPPSTAPRSSPQDGNKIAAVTPENQVDMLEDKSKSRRTKRSNSSHSQSNVMATKGPRTGKF